MQGRKTNRQSTIASPVGGIVSPASEKGLIGSLGGGDLQEPRCARQTAKEVVCGTGLTSDEACAAAEAVQPYPPFDCPNPCVLTIIAEAPRITQKDGRFTCCITYHFECRPPGSAG